jgi:hypothetical protein
MEAKQERESMGIDTASIQAVFPAGFVLLAAVAVTLAILVLFTLFALRYWGAQYEGLVSIASLGLVLWARIYRVYLRPNIPIIILGSRVYAT